MLSSGRPAPGRVSRWAGPLRSPTQAWLGMMVLGAGIACLAFATLGPSIGSSSPAATVTVTALSGAGPVRPTPVRPTPARPSATRPTPRVSRTPARPGRGAGAHPVHHSTAGSGPRTHPAATKTTTTAGSTPRAASSSAVDPSVNLAAARPVRASSHAQDYVASHITDADVNTYWEAEPGFPQTVAIDLGRLRRVSRVVLSLPPAPDWNRRTQTIALDGSPDGRTYRPVAPAALYAFDANTAAKDEVAVAVPGTRTRYLRLTFTANDGWPAAQLSGLRAYAG